MDIEIASVPRIIATLECGITRHPVITEPLAYKPARCYKSHEDPRLITTFTSLCNTPAKNFHKLKISNIISKNM